MEQVTWLDAGLDVQLYLPNSHQQLCIIIVLVMISIWHSAKVVKEVQAMLDTVKQLGIFLKYSPKRSRHFEAAMLANRNQADHIKESKLSLFRETRWAEKHIILNTFDV